MERSITLLNRALESVGHNQLADEIGVSSSALSNCKKMGQLTPVVAGNIAAFLNENVEHWIAIAAVESVRPCKAKELLMSRFERRVKSSF